MRVRSLRFHVAWIFLAAVGLVFFLSGGCNGLRKAKFTARAYLRGDGDYDELEANRAGHAPAERTAEALPGYWTDFRGPGRRGVYDETAIRLDWPDEGLPLLWRQPVGPGYGSFTVAEGLAFTLEQRRANEAVTAYDLATGAEVWIHGYAARFDETLSGEGPRATPVYADGSVYNLGTTGELRCLDASNGELRWRRDVLAEEGAQNLKYGLASSPLVVGDVVIAQGARSVRAYERATGEPRWSAFDERMAYASPALARLCGREQLVVFTAERICGLDASSGSILWSHPWKVTYGLSCSQPVFVDERRILLSAGYGIGAALVELERDGDTFTARRVWKNARLKNRFNSSVLHEGHVYGLDEGRLVCLEAATGNRLWKGGRYGYGQVLLTAGHLVISSEDGELALVRATPETYEELARFDGIDGMTCNLPALAHGFLLLRNHEEMACFDARPPGLPGGAR